MATSTNCKFCEHNSPIINCKTCEIWCCYKCFDNHKSSCKRLTEFQYHICKRHTRPVEGFCYKCYEIICKECAIQNHKGHNIFSIPTGLRNITSKYTAAVSEDLLEKEIRLKSFFQTCQANFPGEIQFLATCIKEEEEKWKKSIAGVKDELILHLGNMQMFYHSKEKIEELLKKAKVNFDSLRNENFSLTTLWRWSCIMRLLQKCNYMFIIGKTNIVGNLTNVSDIRQLFRSRVIHLKPDIQLISNIAKDMSEMVAIIDHDQWKTQGDTVTLPCTSSPEINAFIKNIEIVYNFIIRLKNNLIQSQKDLKRSINKNAECTNRETTDREQEKGIHMTDVHQKDKNVIQSQKDLKRSINKNAECTNRETTDREQEKGIHMTDVHQKDKNVLSSVADEKLAKDEPPIMDLGDPNRPMRIGVKFSELYDSEWTDAMGNISRVKKYYPDMIESEIQEIIMRHLHRLLKCCYRECHMKAEEQIRRLRETLAETMCLTFKSTEEFTSLPVCREASVLRRTKSEGFANFLFQNQKKFTIIIKTSDKKMLCKNIITDWDYINKNEQVMKILKKSTFFEKCVYLCWLMVIQDPIMYLDDDPVLYAQIDKNAYEEFGKSGDSVAYVIWPALFLHKGGPLIFKGVVQTYWKKDGNSDGTRV